MPIYIARKDFTYAGTHVLRGQVWEPGGHRNDAAIIKGRLVIEQKPQEAESDAAPGDVAEQAPPRKRGREVTRNAG